ncbi:hypothetical protein PLESTF_001055500 [Pleodorina starrii]|nr:hypothetical protein PLESTM_001639700 [Pleodorina starrii]GLC44763.1 hypothetical protein PLESTM_001640100 [Pleodorina starrii]GLC70962.1 hypothetical protein PLESTF_001055500 [Pleodorina starrii]
MDMDSSFACGGWPSMHQPVDWDYTGFLPDMFAPLQASSPVPQQQQNPQQQQQQTAVNTTTMVPGPPTYATFHGTWASSMHQPVDWEVPAMLSATQPAVQPLQAATSNVATQQQPAPSAVAPASAQPASSVLAPAATATGAVAKEPGSNNSNKRERGARRAKSATLRPQQQQMLDLQKKLDALLQEHAVVEAENERLKTRLRVLEAVLPVRQQQARWAQSAAAAATARIAAQPTDPVIASLLDLATSGPSSCATSPARGEAATPACAGCGTGGVDAAGGGCTADDAPAAAAAQGDNMATGSPPLAAAHAEPASSSCGTTCTTTSGSHPPAARGFGHHRSCSVNTNTRGCGGGGGGAARTGHHAHPPHRHHSQHSLGAHGGGASSRDPHSDSHTRWLEAWRGWVREAALLLQAYDARPNDHYLNRLDEAFTKLKSEVVFLGLRHPELVCNMRCVNLETGAEQEFPPDNFWSLVVAGMKLDAQQVANCKSALGLYRERMSVVLAERRSLAAQMSTCLTALQLEEADGRALPGSMRREQLTLDAEEAASALDANVAMEGHTTSLARDLLGSNLFSRLQVARACVLSYPYFPDALAIITAAVGDDGAAPLSAPAQPTKSGDAAQPQAQS